MRVWAIAGAGALLASLGGCAVPTAVTIASYAADGASFLSTGRSVTDHGISILMQEDCALFRVVRGKPICRPMQKSDLVYGVAFAERRFDYRDPDDPALRQEPIQLAVTRSAPNVVPKAEMSPEPLAPLAWQLASAADAKPNASLKRADAPPNRAIARAVQKTSPNQHAARIARSATTSSRRQPMITPRQKPQRQPQAAPSMMAAAKPQQSQARAPDSAKAMHAPAARTTPGYRVVAGAFDRRDLAELRRSKVIAQLSRLGRSTIGVQIARLPKGSPATYVVLTRPVVAHDANVLVGQLQLDKGETPWKMRSARSYL